MPKQAPKITYTTLFADESVHPKFEAALKKFKPRMGERHPMHIGGKKVWSEEGEFEVRSPSDTSVVVGSFQRGTRKDAKEAVQAAEEGFGKWSSTSWERRVAVMEKFASLVDERKFDIAVAISYEVGKNRLEALAECWESMDAVRYYAKKMREEKGYTSRMGGGGPGEHCVVAAKPHGVWPVISPFNFPFMLASGMALGALVTGNAVVLKPTSAAPLTGLMLYTAYNDAGVPAGAVNYVTGPGPNFEDEFVTNPGVAGIAFTGSRDVGMKIYRRFLSEQPFPKPIVLEMGSKNPTIVTAKADMEKAVEGTVRAAFGYGGQKCSATSRVYVQESVKGVFLRDLKERVERLTVGDPTAKGTFMGPVINRAAVAKFEAAVSEARKAGGKVVAGGSVLKGRGISKGYFVEPTVVADLPEGNRLLRDELFLPFVAVQGVGSVEDAIDEANATEYGLTAGIFSEDKREVKKFFDGIHFGVVYANRSGGSTTGAWPGAQSFTGWNASGATGRGVGSPHYLLNFLRDQSLTTVS